MKTDRGAAYKALTTDVTTGMALASVGDSLWPSMKTLQGAALSTAVYNTRVSVFAITHQLEAAALLYRLTGEARYLTEAKKRGEELVSLNPDGNTGYEYSDSDRKSTRLNSSHWE